MSSNCYSYYMHVFKVADKIKEEMFIPSRCKSWGCEHCRRVKARLVKEFIKKSFAGCQLQMLTFTESHKGKAVDAWSRIGPRWNVIRAWLTKTYPGIRYCRVIEPHKKGGWPHMHVLVDKPVSEPKVRSLLKQWGFGYIYDQRDKTAAAASAYLSGYLTKKWPGSLANHYRQLTKTRIVQASQSLGPIFPQVSGWKLVHRRVPIDEVQDYAWDIYKERFISCQHGARLIYKEECIIIQSMALQKDIDAFRQLTGERAVVSIEDLGDDGREKIWVQLALKIPA